MADLTGMMQAAAGQAGGENLYIEDVFSTYLYTGNGSTQTITNGIDLDGEGGLVWIKNRDQTDNHVLTDTERGATEILASNTTGAEATDADTLTAFNSNGFAIGADVKVNTSTEKYVSWAFRKAPKFFDVVTYTGTGSARTVAHNLGSVPGCIIVKRTDTTGDWQVYHRANTANPETDYLVLNSTAATADSNTRWNDTLPTDSVFTVGTQSTVNASGGTYVAYLFAHDAGGFGDDGEQNVITCGSFTTDGGGSATVNLGYEPQFLITKSASTNDTVGWSMYDMMREFNSGVAGLRLIPNSSSAETGGGFAAGVKSNGFSVVAPATSATYIYIAIRRGPMKTPTAGTEVYNGITRTGTGAAATVTSIGFPPDMVLSELRAGPEGFMANRLAGFTNTAAQYLFTAYNLAEFSATTGTGGIILDGTTTGTVSLTSGSSNLNGSGNAYIDYFFRRAPGFMDVVCYTGDGATTQLVSHNLGVKPELVIQKRRNSTSDWYAANAIDGSIGLTLFLNSTAATGQTQAVLYTLIDAIGAFSSTAGNISGATYVTYLFASVAGVSDIGTYTGNGTSVSVTTGFQPRFILVKRTDSTGNWILGDSARGLVAGNDPALFLNALTAETTGQDWVDVSATGFTVNETALNANVNTGTYLYLAIS